MAVLERARYDVRMFESRWQKEIAGRTPRPVFPVFAECEQAVGIGYCYGRDNGKMAYSDWSGTPNAEILAPDLVPRGLQKQARSMVGQLVATLKEARSRIPGDKWIAGQLVRINLDRGDALAAFNEATSCTAVRWWCEALAAHSLHLMGALPGTVDSMWTEALVHMPATERCAWLDPGDVIQSDSLRRAVGAMDCNRKTDFAERLWWLADPLYQTPGNERRSEHLSRQAALMLDTFYAQRLDSALVRLMHFASTAPESPPRGGAGTTHAQAPASVVAGASRHPFVQSAPGYDHLVRRLGVPGFISSTRFEPGEISRLVALYPYPRYALVPAAPALVRPVDANAEDWKVSDPRQYEFFCRTPVRFEEIEHQSALFRRGDSARLTVAADISGLPALKGKGAVGALIVRQDYTLSGLRVERSIRSLFVAGAPVPRGGALASLEILSPDRRRAARVRFGARLPDATQQRITLSDILLMEPVASPPPLLEEAEAYALGSLRLQRRSLGMFFEIYGLGKGESPTIEVRAEPVDGRITRVLQAIALHPRSNRLSVSWPDEPARGGDFESRSVMLDLSTLKPGKYKLIVGVTSGNITAESTRAIEIL